MRHGRRPSGLRILVVTVVHHPLDARITQREARSLAEAGHEVTLAAPWTPSTPVPAWVRPVTLPRASGRNRLPALRAARGVVGQMGGNADLVLLHDPELVPAVAGLPRPPTVWDVHEDTAAALIDKPWLPARLRRSARAGVEVLERAAERHLHLLLAEDGYQSRFSKPHPVVPNDTVVPSVVQPPGADRVVYLGRISRGRGADTLLALPDMLPEGVRLELVGTADPDVAPQLVAARDTGKLDWAGFLPNDAALARLDGALAGLSPLRDQPNYAHSRPTKVIEYMAHGVPVVTTPSPIAARIVREADAGIVVGFDDPRAVASAIVDLRSDPARRAQLGRNGHAAARKRFDWHRSGAAFVAHLERWATEGSTT